MTPLLIPGAEGDVPIMTWGQVDSTPLRVPEPFDAAEAAAAERSDRGAGFHIKGPSHRERVASALEAKTRGAGSGKSGSKRQRQQQQATPLTGKRDVRSLTPAAQSLAAKLAGSLKHHQEAHGGGAYGSQLRASYGGASSSSSAAAVSRPASVLGATRAGSSSRAASAAAASAARAGAAAAAAAIGTPVPSPMRAAPAAKRAKPVAAAAAAGGGGGTEGSKSKSKSSGLTANLLNI